jgi:hypothetical protein
MVYGILLESVVQYFILEKYDRITLQEVEEYVQCSLSNLNLFDLYDDGLMIAIAEGMSLYLPCSQMLFFVVVFVFVMAEFTLTMKNLRIVEGTTNEN